VRVPLYLYGLLVLIPFYNQFFKVFYGIFSGVYI
jgi:hypothetical protein